MCRAPTSCATSLLVSGLLALWLKGLTHYATLEAVERTRFALLFNHGMRVTETLYVNHLDGRISRARYGTYAAPLDHMITLPGLQAWWEERAGDSRRRSGG